MLIYPRLLAMSFLIDEIMAGLFPREEETQQKGSLFGRYVVTTFEVVSQFDIDFYLDKLMSTTYDVDTRETGTQFLDRVVLLLAGYLKKPLDVEDLYYIRIFVLTLLAVSVFAVTGAVFLSWLVVQVGSESPDNEKNTFTLLDLDINADSAFYNHNNSDESLMESEIFSYNNTLDVGNVPSGIMNEAFFSKNMNSLEPRIDYDEIIDCYAGNFSSSAEKSTAQYQIEKKKGKEKNGSSNTNDFPIVAESLAFNKNEFALPSVLQASFHAEQNIIQGRKVSNNPAKISISKEDNSQDSLQILNSLTDIYDSKYLDAYLRNTYSLFYPEYDSNSKVYKPLQQTADSDTALTVFDNKNIKEFYEPHKVLELQLFRYYMSKQLHHDSFLLELFNNAEFLYDIVLDGKVTEESKVVIFKTLIDSFTDETLLQITVNYTSTVIWSLLKRLSCINNTESGEYQVGVISLWMIINTLSVEDFNDLVLNTLYNRVISDIQDPNLKIKALNVFFEVLKLDLFKRCSTMKLIDDYKGINEFFSVVKPNMATICTKHSSAGQNSVPISSIWMSLQSTHMHSRNLLQTEDTLCRSNSMNKNKNKLKDNRYKEHKSSHNDPVFLANNIGITNRGLATRK